MEQATKILVVDDDKFIQKIVDRTLSAEGFEVLIASDGAAGVECAIEHTPDIIVLDVEMPNMNGYEACEKLKSDDRTKEIPVVFLSSHGDLRSRMQGYEAGAADYLIKPFEKEDLIAKMWVLWTFLEQQHALEKEYRDARETARIALSATSELSLAMQFIENSYSYSDFLNLAQAMMTSLAQLDIDCVLMISGEDDTLWYASDGNPTPLEQEMLELADRDQRFIDFGMRTIVNYQNITGLMRNMPLEDMERYGRIKDLIPVLMSAADVKINSIKAENATAKQSLEVLSTFGGVRSKLYFLAKSLIDSQQQSTELLHGTVTELNHDLLGMGLEEDQEAQILHRLDEAIATVSSKLDNSAMLHKIFRDVLDNLKDIAARQDELHKVFVDMNSAQLADPVADADDSIELF